ncbi:DVUA0089 family protein [Chamaesiphon minutus]|uniref:PEP-CTERM exosortase interaction domain-containing protein n=1 Tax=Chamaesiphon minutus (strain ATCC 27169 / PCC 6605) TaxID=1173020 RepID=K9UBQ5_CHAP6|nr:DVUA0089 family protein [Chamaesiphon minutus]AFY92068.1 hypothetical protein Cha6605_0800 [Chamaesiphon minutus PCC 6605]
MKTSNITKLLGIAAVTAGTFASAAPAFGATIATLSGSLANEDAIANVTFVAPSTLVNFKTTSYSTDNFSPVLTLFDGTDDYVNEYIDIGDLNFDLTLTSGITYRAVISAFGRYFNSPINVNFSEGFSGSGSFGLDNNGAPLGSNYALTISTVTTAVPEPADFIGTAIAGLALVGLKRRSIVGLRSKMS